MGRLDALFGTKKDQELFALFEQLGALARQAGHTFWELAQDLPNSGSHAKKLHEVEHQADAVVGGIFSLLDSASFLAFDHEDIKLLAQKGDNVIDELWKAANIIGNVCQLRDADPQLLEAAVVIKQMCLDIEKLLKNLKCIKCVHDLQEIIIHIHEQESVVDELRDLAYSNRFVAARSLQLSSLAILLIAWKDVYAHLDFSANSCEDVADILAHFPQKYYSVT